MVKVFHEKFMCEFSSLFKTVHAFAYFHVNLSITIGQVVKFICNNNMAIGYYVAFWDWGFVDEEGSISTWELCMALGEVT